ncbi:MAG: rhombosortase [Nitrosomonadales bacterium]|nr:rhombosortase [Nitrosomonadales bacterium]
MRYDRSALADGELWRVFTAHLSHLNLTHLFLNLLGLFLICELLWGELPLRHGIALLGFSAAAISAALWWLHPGLIWYVGLSGVLHGLWAGCVVQGLWERPPGRDSSFRDRVVAPTAAYLGGLILLMIKLSMEFFYGPPASTAHLIGGSVVTASHLYGALAGLLYVSIWRIFGILRT